LKIKYNIKSKENKYVIIDLKYLYYNICKWLNNSSSYNNMMGGADINQNSQNNIFHFNKQLIIFKN
jgi:hypothetical protein